MAASTHERSAQLWRCTLSYSRPRSVVPSASLRHIRTLGRSRRSSLHRSAIIGRRTYESRPTRMNGKPRSSQCCRSSRERLDDRVRGDQPFEWQFCPTRQRWSLAALRWTIGRGGRLASVSHAKGKTRSSAPRCSSRNLTLLLRLLHPSPLAATLPQKEAIALAEAFFRVSRRSTERRPKARS